MKSLCFAAAVGALVVFVTFAAGCASPSSPAGNETVWPGTPGTNAYLLHAPDSAPPRNAGTRPPRLTVGTSYPDTQLILPWFLNDIIDFVNYR
jgi:hypothetical protein